MDYTELQKEYEYKLKNEKKLNKNYELKEHEIMINYIFNNKLKSKFLDYEKRGYDFEIIEKLLKDFYRDFIKNVIDSYNAFKRINKLLLELAPFDIDYNDINQRYKDSYNLVINNKNLLYMLLNDDIDVNKIVEDLKNIYKSYNELYKRGLIKKDAPYKDDMSIELQKAIRNVE